MGYRCEAMSVGGFVQQLAVAYLRNGYWFYAAGAVPPRKDPREVDAKLVEKYQIGASKWARARRKRAGEANLQYLRFDRFFLLLATAGRHRFFEEEAGVVRDARRRAIAFLGYSVSYRAGHPHVRIAREQYLEIKAYLVEVAPSRSAGVLERAIHGLPFEPYAPVRRQFFEILRAVNRRRAEAGLEQLSPACVRTRRRVCRPFGGDEDAERAGRPSAPKGGPECVLDALDRERQGEDPPRAGLDEAAHFLPRPDRADGDHRGRPAQGRRRRPPQERQGPAAGEAERDEANVESVRKQVGGAGARVLGEREAGALHPEGGEDLPELPLAGGVRLDD